VVLDSAVRAGALADIEKLRTSLKATPASYQGWIDLGMKYKLVGDYAKAEAAWKYAALLSPKDRMAPYALGDLYEYYIKNAGVAEQNFLKAIANDPHFAPAYLSLDQLYTVTLGKPELGAKILSQGVAANPGNVTLLLPAARRFASIKDNPTATLYYNQVIARAKETNDAKLEETATLELRGL
jgi:tetratricopeptide (TPR) repeat protein